MPRSLLWGIITGKYKSSRDFNGDPDLPLGWPLSSREYKTWGDIKKRRVENQDRRRGARRGGRNEHMDELEDEEEEQHRSRHRERRHRGGHEHRQSHGHRPQHQGYEQAEARQHHSAGHHDKDRVYQQQRCPDADGAKGERTEHDDTAAKDAKRVSFNNKARVWDGVRKRKAAPGR